MRTALLALLLPLLPVWVWAEEIDLTVKQVPLNEADVGMDRIGALEFLGGLEIDSPAAGFGGWSGGWASEDLSSLILLTDRGLFADVSLERDPDSGALIGLKAGPLRPVQDRAGLPLAGKLNWDAEALEQLGEGRFAVGFEQSHRIWLYDEGLDRPASADIGPAALAALPVSAMNSGVEALALSPDGEMLIAILEGGNADGQTRAFLRRDEQWRERPFQTEPEFGVTDAAFLENGDLLVLERFYSRATGPLVKLRRVAAETLAGDGLIEGEVLAAFERPMSVDNFEILLLGRDADGSPLVLIGSDDNFNAAQRFLLLLFRLGAEHQ